MFKTILISIGGIRIAVEFNRLDIADNFEGLYTRFLVKSAEPEVSLRVNFQSEDLPGLSGWDLIFDSDGPWQLFQSQGKFALQRTSPAVTPNVYQVCFFDQDFHTGEIFVLDLPGSAYFYIYNFIIEFVMINLLSQRQGMLLHAAAVRDGEIGRIFSGHSGAGKSTISHLWINGQVGRILCDDRVIVRKQDGEFMVYGTPWYGTAGIAIPDSAPLRQVFTLTQALQNKALPLHPVDAASRLLSRAFPPFWNQQAMQNTLDFLADLCQTVACYDLQFKPDADVIEFIRCLT